MLVSEDAWFPYAFVCATLDLIFVYRKNLIS